METFDSGKYGIIGELVVLNFLTKLLNCILMPAISGALPLLPCGSWHAEQLFMRNHFFPSSTLPEGVLQELSKLTKRKSPIVKIRE